MVVVAILVVAGIAAIAFFAYQMTGELRNLHAVTKDVRTLLLTGYRDQFETLGFYHTGTPHMSALSVGFFTIWEWRENKWHLKTTLVPPGVDPGLPPTYPGNYEGDVVKKWVPGSRL